MLEKSNDVIDSTLGADCVSSTNRYCSDAVGRVAAKLWPPLVTVTVPLVTPQGMVEPEEVKQSWPIPVRDAIPLGAGFHTVTGRLQ